MSTASSSSSAPKRKRSEASITSSDENASETHFLNWLSSGTTSSSPKDGPEVIDHEEAELRIGGKRVIAHVGDVVYLRAFASSSSVSNSSQKQQQDVDEYASDDVDYYGEQNERMASASIARIERLYETRNASEGAHRKIRARWFLKVRKIFSLQKSCTSIFSLPLTAMLILLVPLEEGHCRLTRRHPRYLRISRRFHEQSECQRCHSQ